MKKKYTREFKSEAVRLVTENGYSLKEASEIAYLRKSLMFLHVQELKELSVRLFLIDKGNKKAIILRICHFLLTGEKLTAPKFPKESCAQRGKEYPLETHGLILKGFYKNDLKTRLFFKHLIGPHFHFTAFGIDWINESWFLNLNEAKIIIEKWRNYYNFERPHTSLCGMSPIQFLNSIKKQKKEKLIA